MDAAAAAAAAAPKSMSMSGSQRTTGTQKQLIPEALMPALARLINGAGSMGMERLVNTFIDLNPNVKISKRQARLKVKEVGAKQKQGVGPPVWQVLPQFRHLLTGGAKNKRKQPGAASGAPPKKPRASPVDPTGQ